MGCTSSRNKGTVSGGNVSITGIEIIRAAIKQEGYKSGVPGTISKTLSESVVRYYMYIGFLLDIKACCK